MQKNIIPQFYFFTNKTNKLKTLSERTATLWFQKIAPMVQHNWDYWAMIHWNYNRYVIWMIKF